jgi:hypothetical protein
VRRTVLLNPDQDAQEEGHDHQAQGEGPFEFSSTTTGATFECSIDGKTFRACTTGQTLKLKVGKHTFAVRAVASGQTDPTPATFSFKVKRKR